ncbi:DUF7837 family putative zinc-binding protein [Natronobacterium lacisalsi]
MSVYLARETKPGLYAECPLCRDVVNPQ